MERVKYPFSPDAFGCIGQEPVRYEFVFLNGYFVCPFFYREKVGVEYQ